MRLIPILAALVTGLAFADRNNYEARTFTGYQNKTLPYRLFAPKNLSAGERVPLMLALHGAGERGADNAGQLNHAFTHMWSDAAIQAAHPSFVAAPQCPAGGWWDGPWLMALVESLEKQHAIDSKRIYVSGLSMGGYGTWDLVTRYPGRFAAAVPVCGGGDTAKAAALVKQALWAFHGSADLIVPVRNSRDMVAAIRARGGSPKYTEYAGVGHDSWVNAAKEPGLVEWVYGQGLASAVFPGARAARWPRKAPRSATATVLFGERRFDLSGRALAPISAAR